MLDKKKIYKTANARIYYSKQINSWYWIPDGNYNTVAQNMRHRGTVRNVCDRVVDGQRMTEAEAEREISA